MTPLSATTPIVVVGLMGSGKTSVSRLLAEALGRPMRDSDPDMRERYGQSAAEMAKTVGADELHRRELSHLRESLAENPPCVIAAAASTLEAPDAPALLEPALVVWLDAPDSVLAERMLSSSHRPHFESDLHAMLAKQRAVRGPVLQRVADLTYDVSTRKPEEVASLILAELRSPGVTPPA